MFLFWFSRSQALFSTWDMLCKTYSIKHKQFLFKNKSCFFRNFKDYIFEQLLINHLPNNLVSFPLTPNSSLGCYPESLAWYQQLLILSFELGAPQHQSIKHVQWQSTISVFQEFSLLFIDVFIHLLLIFILFCLW